MNEDIKRDIEPANDAPVPALRASVVAANRKPQTRRKKLKILFLAVNDTKGDLKLDEEYREIDLSVARRQDKLELVSKFAIRRSELQQGLLQHTPDVVHFGGHGTPSGELMLRGDDETLSLVSADALRLLFETLRDNVRLVVLNACFSTEQATAIRDGVGIAIGMRRQISDHAAIAFSAAFYEALAYRRAVREAFDLGIAAIKTQGMADEANVPELLVRPDLDASVVYLIAASDSTNRPERVSSLALRTRRMVFIALFLASVMFAVLFGAGILRQNIISEYVVLVILGGLTGILTWGILSSSGEIKGSGYGVSLKLGGSSVTLGATLAGGLWLAASEGEFAIKIKFVDEVRQPVNVNSTVRLEIDGYTSTMSVKALT